MNCIVLYTAILGYSNGAVGGAITAVVIVHCVIAAYIYVAWKEGSTKTDWALIDNYEIIICVV